MKIIVFALLAGMCNIGLTQSWVENFEEAKSLALENDQKIVVVFAGSDWCAPCIKLDKYVLSTNEFLDLSRDHFVLLKANFPRKKKNKLPKEKQEQNKWLASKYNQKGYFPLVVVMDHTGKVLGETGYKKMSPKEYFELLKSLEG